MINRYVFQGRWVKRESLFTPKHLFWKNYWNFTNRDYHGISVADTELPLIKINQTCFN